MSIIRVLWKVGLLKFAAVLCLQVSPLIAEPIQWVTVGDPGNAADINGYGAVDTSF